MHVNGFPNAFSSDRSIWFHRDLHLFFDEQSQHLAHILLTLASEARPGSKLQDGRARVGTNIIEKSRLTADFQEKFPGY